MTNEEKRERFKCPDCDGDGKPRDIRRYEFAEYCLSCKDGTGIDWQAYAGWLEGENEKKDKIIKSIIEFYGGFVKHFLSEDEQKKIISRLEKELEG